MSESAALLPGCCNNQPVSLSVAGRTAFALGARGLLEGPVVVLTGARLPRPDSHRLAVRAAGLLARAGFVVGAVASLGALSAAVLVIDDRGLPDALYIAEMALARRRPVLFYGGAGAYWPGRLDRPGVSLRCTVPAMLRALAPLCPGGRVAGL